MKKILALEERFIRAETWLLVALVIIMLVLALYGVFYRNVLVPWQKDLAVSGPPVVVEVEVPTPKTTGAEPSNDKATPDKGGDDGAGGFGGGFGGGDEGEEDDDGAGGFGGGFGGGGEPDEAEKKPDEAKKKPEEPDDGAGGFGGGFGGDEGEDKGEDDDGAGGFGGGFGGGDGDEGDDDGGGFGGGFGTAETDEKDPDKTSKAAVPVKTADTEPDKPEGGPPPEGSFGAWMVDLIDTLKLEWVDVVLRQFVVLVGFFGAMLATRRRKHINIDALSRLLPDQARRIVGVLTNLLSVVICVFLAIAGIKLVQMSHEYPTELTEWADEWTFQIMFPLGFGLLAFHFAIRTLEALIILRDRLPVAHEGGLERPPPKPKSAEGPPPAGLDESPPEPEPDPDPPSAAPKATKPAGSAKAGKGKKKKGKGGKSKRKKGGRR